MRRVSIGRTVSKAISTLFAGDRRVGVPGDAFSRLIRADVAYRSSGELAETAQ